MLSAGSDAIGGFELAGAYKSLAKLGLKHGVKRSASEVLELAQKFLRKGYKESVPGSGRFVSADGLMVFRMGPEDIAPFNGKPAHVNFERLIPNSLKPGKNKIIENIHVYLQ